MAPCTAAQPSQSSLWVFSAGGQRVEVPNHRFCKLERGLGRIRGESILVLCGLSLRYQ